MKKNQKKGRIYVGQTGPKMEQRTWEPLNGPKNRSTAARGGRNRQADDTQRDPQEYNSQEIQRPVGLDRTTTMGHQGPQTSHTGPLNTTGMQGEPGPTKPATQPH